MKTCHGDSASRMALLRPTAPGHPHNRQHNRSINSRLRRHTPFAAPAAAHMLLAGEDRSALPAGKARHRFPTSAQQPISRRSTFLQAQATRQQYISATTQLEGLNSSAKSTAATAAAAAAAAVSGPPPTAAAAASAAAVAYSAADTADTWNRRPVPVVARLCEIGVAFGGWWLRAQLHRDERRAAADMRKVLVDLGPAFVKIGQALSSRPDVLPPAYLAELELLQDRIPPFSDVEALQVIEAELGVPWGAVFSSLSASPVAAASLGQVYKGTLASNGAEVAVKVQRPGVVEAIGRDTFILRNLAAVARRQLKLNTDLPALVDEWAASLFKELDYRREAANAIRFAELFAFMPEVVVPAMYSQLTTPRVLVMQWIQGERLRSASSQAPAAAAAAAAVSGVGVVGSSQLQAQQNAAQVAEDLRLVEIGVRCSLEQMLEEGFYHADPHPGNLLKTQDGRLAYLDFGMMGEVEPPVRQALIRATLHLVNREYERLAEDFVVLGLLPQGTDMDDVLPALSGVFQTALAGGVSNISFSSLSADLGRTMYRYSFRIPPYYTLLVRSLSVLEGIALASDPNYKVLGAAYPWVSRRLLTQDSPELHATLNNLLYDKSGQFQFDRLESLLEQAAKAAVNSRSSSSTAVPVSTAAGQATNSSLQTTTVAAAAGSGGLFGSVWGPASAVAGPAGELLGSLLPAALGNTASGLLGSLGPQQQQQQQQQQRVGGRGSEAAAAGGPLALVLSPEGRYIRGILEDELAKGLDAAWRLAVDDSLAAAGHQLEGALAALPPALLPPWLQRQPTAAADAAGMPGSSSDNSYDSSFDNGVGDVRVALVETMMNVPKLAAAEDKAQVDGLTRLATQLAAFSTASRQQQQQQHMQQPLQAVFVTSSSQQQQQELVQQLQQTAVVLQWLLSEVQLLSPEARREALSIPLNILSKLASRLAARAVRAVLTPRPLSPGTASSSTARAGYNSRSSSSVKVARERQITGSSRSSNSSWADDGTSSSSRSSTSGNRTVVPDTQQQQQQQYKQRMAGQSRPKQPAQRVLTYTPEQRQQEQQRALGMPAAPSKPPAGGILAATVRSSKAAAAAAAGSGSNGSGQAQAEATSNGKRKAGGSSRAGNGSSSSSSGANRQRQLLLVEQQREPVGALPAGAGAGAAAAAAARGGGGEGVLVVVEPDAVLAPPDGTGLSN